MADYFGQALRTVANPGVIDTRRPDQVYASDASAEIRIGDRTEVHGTCLRKQYYRMTGVKQSDVDERSATGPAAIGSIIHDWAAGIFAQAGMLARAECPLWIPEIKLSGRVDAIVKSEGELVGVEVKTVGGYHGRKGTIDARRNAPFYPRLYHLTQAIIYAHHFADQGVRRWQLLYIDRENGDYHGHDIVYDGPESVWVNGEPTSITPTKIITRWKRLWDCIDVEQLPNRDYLIQYPAERLQQMAQAGLLNKADTEKVSRGKAVDKGDFQCRSCPWRTRCWTVDV
jgi:hypothetical protein